MNKADKLMKPDIERCPGCGIDTRAGIETGAIEPDCRHQQFDADGNLLDFTLYWECNRCGCNWKHGQFSGEETLSGDKFDLEITVRGEAGAGKTAIAWLIQDALLKHGISLTQTDEDLVTMGKRTNTGDKIAALRESGKQVVIRTELTKRA
jgi:hypothetical protein